jgi:hypothetical protein
MDAAKAAIVKIAAKNKRRVERIFIKHKNCEIYCRFEKENNI